MASPANQPEQLEFFQFGTDQLISTTAVEIAPGVHRLLEPNLVPPDAFPRYGICEFVRRPDGSFIAIARTHGQLIKLTENIGQELGVKNKDSEGFYKFLKRAIWAGFVTAVCQPDAYYIDQHSLFAFLRKIRNPGFWTPERKARYRAARDGIKPDPDEKSWPPADTQS